MNITAIKTDTANVSVVAKVEASDIEKNITKAAKKLAKTASIDGFRKGKVPVATVKKMYAEQLSSDAENQAIQEIVETAKKDLEINQADIIADPAFTKYEKVEDGIEVELTISLRPTIEAEGYEKLAPSYEEPTVDDAELEERLQTLLDNNAPFKKLTESRALATDDQANFDFVGKIDGEEFEGGASESFDLTIGSGQFIPGFEDQMVGMNSGETKEITVTFPTDYQSADLAGKEALFTVTLNSIKVKSSAGYAVDIDAEEVWYGAHAGDHAIYPDCRPEFVEKMNDVAAIANFSPVTLFAPYLYKDKFDILKEGISMGLDYSNTWTCYKGKAKACGTCGSCTERLEAFEKLRLKDPLEYD